MNSFRRLSVCCLAAAALVLGGCSAAPRFSERPGRSSSDKSSTLHEAAPTENAANDTGDKGKILLSIDGIASYYADDFNGKKTSNGEMFDMNTFTAAHKTFPFGTKVRVVNKENNRSVIVRINDRGPFHEDRILDLSLAAAKQIDLIRTGTARVRLEVLEWGNGK